MKQITFIFIFILLFSCTDNTNGGSEEKDSIKVPDDKQVSDLIPLETENQVNITILIDLSDRINVKKNHCNPEHYERDIELP